MIKKIVFIVIINFISLTIHAQDVYYEQAFSYIEKMLSGESDLNFKDAVLFTEYAYYDGRLDTQIINEQYETLCRLIDGLSKSNLITYTDKDKEIVTKHAAIFKVLTDTVLIPIDSTLIYEHAPYAYDFEDPLGHTDWEKMFVTKLLKTRKGNCHSLPYLYKILADQFNVPCNLALAPNHIYIKLFSDNIGWYNTELTSATFPSDAWIVASGYVTVDAIRNGVYMDTLSNKQAVANCLLDLAQGYQHKFGKDNPDFVIKCCNTALKYHPINVNALLTRAEAQKHNIHTLMKEKNLKEPKELFADQAIKEMYDEMESTYIQVHKLGYRQMPEEMYIQWINLMNEKPDIYTNEKMKNN